MQIRGSHEDTFSPSYLEQLTYGLKPVPFKKASSYIPSEARTLQKTEFSRTL